MFAYLKHIAPSGATTDTGQKAINILLLRSKDGRVKYVIAVETIPELSAP